MSTHAVPHHAAADVRVWHGLSVHWAWLAGGYLLAFAVPYVLTDVLDIGRDLFYGVYALSVIALVTIDGLRPRRRRQAALDPGGRARACHRGRAGCSRPPHRGRDGAA